AHGGVAPVAAVAIRGAHPLVADADATGDPDEGVDDEQLAVVARHEAEPGAQAGRVEDAVLDPGPTQTGDEAVPNATHADPVGEEPDAHAALHRIEQRA